MPGYGRFGVLSRVELERFCYLDDEDRRLIAVRRRDYNRLGFAVQVVTVRYLGMFLADPVAVPSELVAYLGEQLDIDDPSCLGEYMVRRTTRFEHQAEIVTSYGLVAFADAEAELAGWICTCCGWPTTNPIAARSRLRPISPRAATIWRGGSSTAVRAR
ncbi:DUF4158 domain-containing protein [Nocardia rhizosphaerihabitans]|uniref:DUF4158 domain-containing protein n=1 Tax=Nocardia rhizosphaerihabitans TaxID=1691570 RepID=UPI00402BD43A